MAPRPQGGLPPGEVSHPGSGHGSMGGPTLRSNVSIQETREKNKLLTEFLLGDPLQRVKPREIWVRQLISPLIEFTGHMVGRQRAAMGVEQEDQLHQDRRRVGLLGAKVEHRHDVALIVTAHRESDPGGQRALVREDHVTEEERAQHLQSCNPPLWIPILESPRVLLHMDLLMEPVHLLLVRPPTNASPSSEALASLQPHQEDFGK